MFNTIIRTLVVLALVLAPLPALATSPAHVGPVEQEAEGADEGDPSCTEPAEPPAEGQPDTPPVEVVYVTETVLVTEVVTVEEIVPVEQIVPVTETVYVTEVVTVEEIVPVEQIIPVEQIVPVTETVYVTEVVTVEEIVPVEQIIPVEQIVPVTETVYVTEVVTVEEIVPVEQIIPVEQIVPVTETVYVTEVVVVEEIVPVEQIVPVTQTVYVTEIVPVEQVVPVTQTIFVTEVVVVEEVVPVEQIVPVTQTVYVTEVVTVPAPASGPVDATALPPIEIVPSLGVPESPDDDLGSWTDLAPSYFEQTPLPVSGMAMYYAPNVMDDVEDYRLRMGKLDPCDICVGSVALLRAGDLNRKVWIQAGDGPMEGPFLVTDVAGRHHIPALIQRGWVVDVDYETAQRWMMQGPIPVTIYDEPPADAVAVMPAKADAGPAEVTHDTAAAAEELVASEAAAQVAAEPPASGPAAVAPSSE